MERSKNNYHLVKPPRYTYKKEINRMVAEAGCRTRKDSVMMVETLDRMLPIIDGLSIIKAMRQKNIQIPVIIITGMSELNDKIEGLDNGALHCYDCWKYTWRTEWQYKTCKF